MDNKKRRLGAAAGIGALLLLILFGWSIKKPADSVVGTEPESGCIIYFMQTADDADSILIKNGEDAVLIDTGEAQDAGHILNVLQTYGVEQLDLMILTHPDKDHIGGAAQIAKEIEVSRIIEPYYTLENERNEALHEWLKQQEILVYTAQETESCQFEDFSLTIYPPQEKEYKKDNNYSLAVLFSHKDSHAFFAGDAVKKRQKELMELELPDIELLKVPYHGRYVKGEEALIEKLSPKYAVVTAIEAEAEVKEALERAGAEIWYTRSGDVVFGTKGEGFYPIK